MLDFVNVSDQVNPNPNSTVRDELLICLLILARHHGRNAAPAGLLSGLPTRGGQLSPLLFERAAHRLGLNSHMVAQPLRRLREKLLPAILLLKDERACVVTARLADGQGWMVVYPEMEDTPVQVSSSELAADYLGHVIYVLPRLGATPAPEHTSAPTGHWFWSAMADNRKLYADVLLAALLSNLFALAMPLFVMNVYDRVVPNRAIETLWVLVAGLALVLVGDLLLRTLRGHFIDLASSRADIRLSAYIMERVLGARLEHRPASVGAFAAHLRSFESVRDFISSATVIGFIDLPFAFVFLLLVGWISWPMLVPLVVGSLLILVYAGAVQARMRSLAESMHQASAQRNATLVEGLSALETLKAMGAEAPVQRQWEHSVAQISHTGVRLRRLAASARNGTAFVQSLTGVVIVILGVYLIQDRQLTTGGLIACSILGSRMLAPLGSVSHLLLQYRGASAALDSLNRLMAHEQERPDGTHYLSRGALQGDIELRNVDFHYPGQTNAALHQVSFHIRAGERVALLGGIGSGKSTVAKLVLGLYQPSAGLVQIDGVDLRQIDPAELRHQIGYVQQDVTLLHASLRDNITIAAPMADDEDVLRAAELAGILPIVNQHPQGFDMLVGERGESLSGGQRQGVALARALVNDPTLLLLDEPTASMDHTAEEGIKQRLVPFLQGKTLLLVSHRASMLDLVDRIIVMDSGRVVADGPKAQVLAALREGRVGRAP